MSDSLVEVREDVGEMVEIEEMSEIGDEMEREVVLAGKKGRGRAKTYAEIQRFEDAKSADIAMEREINGQYWTRRNTIETDDGDKVYYSCKNYKDCPKTAYILRHSDSEDASLWVAECEHIHKAKANCILPKVTVDYVIELLNQGWY